MNTLATKNKQKPSLFIDEPLANYTTWRVGGNAKQLYKPESIEILGQFLKQLPSSEAVLWLGLGSNSLIRDRGFDGTVIITQGCLKSIELIDDRSVRVEAGVSCALMARFCARNNLADAEFWAGIPGTMGGALRMNAGCYNGETWDKLVSVEMMDRKGNITHHNASEFDVGYRNVAGNEDKWFIAANFKFESGDKAQSLKTIKKLLATRSASQPTGEYSCGSVFRNPPGDYAARLIESCGLKGFQIGHACVSEKHANFIINRQGKACAKDIEHLIDTVKAKVLQKTGVELKQEVHIMGD